MRFRSFAFCASVATVFAVLSFGSGVRVASSAAATDSETEYLDPNGDYSHLTEPEALRLAYQVLHDGNHNYNRHRVRAMKEIRQAAKLLGDDASLQGAENTRGGRRALTGHEDSIPGLC